MSGLGALLVSLHVAANVVWIGAILAVGRVLTAADGDAKLRGALAVRIYGSLAVPAFVISFAAGAVRLALDPDYYFVRTHFMHAKLLFALIVIALHHVVGARAKKAASGAAASEAGIPVLAASLFAAAVAAV